MLIDRNKSNVKLNDLLKIAVSKGMNEGKNSTSHLLVYCSFHLVLCCQNL